MYEIVETTFPGSTELQFQTMHSAQIASQFVPVCCVGEKDQSGVYTMQTDLHGTFGL